MQFINRATVPADRETLWRFLMDVRKVGECVPGVEQVQELDPDNGAGLVSYPVITGDYSGTPRWESRPVTVGARVEKPTPVFTKLDPSVVDEELARLGG